jgi:hypothetical protein
MECGKNVKIEKICNYSGARDERAQRRVTSKHLLQLELIGSSGIKLIALFLRL